MREKKLQKKGKKSSIWPQIINENFNFENFMQSQRKLYAVPTCVNKEVGHIG